MCQYITFILHLAFLTCRKECKFVHDFYTDHNHHVLKRYGFENFSSNELRQLLLQNDPSLLPEVSSGVMVPYACFGDPHKVEEAQC